MDMMQVKDVLYNPYVAGLITSAIFVSLMAIFSGLFNVIKKLRYQFLSWKNKSSLRIELSVPISLKNSIPFDDFGDRIEKTIKRDVFKLKCLPGRTVQFKKKMEFFDINGNISPIIEDEKQAEIDSFTLIVSTDNLKFKKLKNGLQTIQNFIFHDIFVLINKDIPIDIDNANEGLTIYFETAPQMISFIDDLKVRSITAQLKSLTVDILKDKISVSGKFENFEDITKIVAKNLIAS